MSAMEMGKIVQRAEADPAGRMEGLGMSIVSGD
jgi:hypothetical protein